MLLRLATRNCGRTIGPLFRIAAAKFHDAKFRELPHSLRVKLRPLPPLFITLTIKHSFLVVCVCSGNGDTPVRFSRGSRSIRADWQSRPAPDLSGKLGACAPIDHELGPGDCWLWVAGIGGVGLIQSILLYPCSYYNVLVSIVVVKYPY